jgi:outer membrane lipoprotein-sorting protein
MSIFERRPGLRWAVPAAAGSLILGGALLAPLAASADAGLPPRTAEELLVDLQQAEPTPVSGTVATRAELGLPSLPMGLAGSGPLALATEDQTLRLWADGPERQRLAVIEDRSETTIVRNGTVAWVWSSADATADRYDLPDGAEQHDLDPADLPPEVTLPSTPQEAAQMALTALDPTTEVTTTGVARVAGRDAYELVLTPRDPETLVARVTIAVDAQTSVPLRVRAFSTRTADPALEVGFTSVDFARPDPSLFEFVPPDGATVTEHPVPSAKELDSDEAAALRDAAAGAPEPTVVGEGWSAVVIADLPVDGLADLAESGMRAEPDGADPATTALALLEALPASSGDWGSGRVLAGTLFSAIVTDDGRIAVGLVDPEALGAALAAR